MKPLTIQEAFDTAVQHHEAGRLAQAARLYELVLAREPDHADALQNLGVLAHQVQNDDQAENLIRKALLIRPDFPEASNNLGNVLMARGQLVGAIAAYRRAIATRPDWVEAYFNLGNALIDHEQTDEAIEAYGQAIAIKPNDPAILNKLGLALARKGQFDLAINACQRAVELQPENPEAYANLGNALGGRGDFEEALLVFQKAVALKPAYAQATKGLGDTLSRMGKFREAVIAYRKALSLQPAEAETHHNLALSLLALGDWKVGWEHYQWRLKCKGFIEASKRFAQPHWDGSPLRERTLLILAEQGFGDTIQFARYLPLLAGNDGRTALECHPELRRLFMPMSDFQCQVFARSQTLPAFDLQCPLISLPRLFHATGASLPATVPYITADATVVAKWRQRLEGFPGMKVGVAWAGSPTQGNDRNRSMRLATLARLGQVAGVRFFSLQKGDAAREVLLHRASLELTDWTNELTDFAETAALIANLDLVVTVDSAVAHLSGAMAKPVWVLLTFLPDWRYISDADGNPWYPSMRLFRQATRGDWGGVAQEVFDALVERVRDHELSKVSPS